LNGVADNTQTLRVTRIITRLNVGGPARQILSLQPKLDAYGIRSELIAGQVDAGEGDLGEMHGFNALIRLPGLRRRLAPLRDYQAYRQLAERVRLFRPHVVHTHLSKAGALGRMAAFRADVPVIVHTFHGHVLEAYFPRPVSQAFVMAERRLARRSDALLAVSAAIRDGLLDLGIGRPHQWHVVEAGLDVEALKRDRPASGDARRRLGLPMNVPLVGMVGRLVPVKDHETFFRAAARIGYEVPGAIFVVAGDGPLRDELERRGRELLGDRVRFTGWVGDLSALYAALDVVVLTSKNEGTPVALIEASAAGKPVVATRVGGIPDFVVEGSTGRLAETGDPTGIAQRVIEVLREPNLSQAMGAAASEAAIRRFSARRLAGELVSLYVELLNRKGIRVETQGGDG
jgi:glycosyltransferase involved in cell wall biosynthesis